jgi:hypothetical protein
MLAIYSVGWEVDAPLFFALPPLPRVYGDLQISFVAAKGGGDLDYLCWQRQIAEAILSRVYSIFSHKNSAEDVLY